MSEASEVEQAAGEMIGDFLITKQTGEDGRICNSVMVTERKYTRKEFYIALMNDRSFEVGPQFSLSFTLPDIPSFPLSHYLPLLFLSR